MVPATMRGLLIIPAYNEAEALPHLLDELTAHPDWKVLVIDDGSTDGTAEVSRAHRARVLKLARNLGIRGAVQAGLHVALREGFDWAVQLDGDRQHPPAEVAQLLVPLADSAGSRDNPAKWT